MKRRWKCHAGVDKRILSIVESNEGITTSRIIVKLKEENIRVTWKLVNSHLVEFEEEGGVSRVQIGQAHKINFWNAA